MFYTDFVSRHEEFDFVIIILIQGNPDISGTGAQRVMLYCQTYTLMNFKGSFVARNNLSFKFKVIFVILFSQAKFFHLISVIKLQDRRYQSKSNLEQCKFDTDSQQLVFSDINMQIIRL